MFISNNPSLISVMCDKAAVLYEGEILEMGTSEEVMQGPAHPYTKALLNSVPKDGEINADYVMNSAVTKAKSCGCVYQNRCAAANEQCREKQKLIKVGKTHLVRCNMAKEGDDVE